MSDLRENLFLVVTSQMCDVLDDIQMHKLKMILLSTLENYEVSPRHTEIIPYNDENYNALEFFLQVLKLNGKAKGTIKQYGMATKKLLDSIGKPFKMIDSFDLMKYFAVLSQQVSDVTYNNYIRYNNQFFQWLSDEGYITGNPMKKIHIVDEEKKVKKAFTDSERARLNDAAETLRDRAILEFLYSTGVRVGECTSVNIADINGDEIIIYGQKSKRERVVFLNDSAKYYLNKYLEERTDDNPALFVTSGMVHDKYNRLSASGIERLVRKIGEKCNIEHAHPHTFRRTLCTNLLARGVDIQTVKAILGHRDISTTEIYNDASIEMIKYKHKLCA